MFRVEKDPGHCETRHDEEFVLRELLNRALIDLSVTGFLVEVFAKSK
ncbi:MAG: hypothetical protein ABEJ58_04250 [Halodesulfurarchaeum sp.]